MDSHHRLATVVRIIDGDTLVAQIDLGFSVSVNESLRLRDVDAPEIRGEDKEAGFRWRDYVERRLAVGSKILIQTFKTRTGRDVTTFSRYVADVFYGPDFERCLNDELRSITE